MNWVLGAAIAVAAALACFLILGVVLRRLPAPEPGVDLGTLDTWRFRAATSATVLGAGVIVALRTSQPGLWLPLLLLAIPACAIDARTTYLPRRLTYAAWAGSLLAVVAVTASTRDASVLTRALMGAAACGAFFYVAWRLGGIGFGDVRLMVSVGAIAAGTSWTTLLIGVFLGAFVGALWALLRLARGKGGGAFAYGPSLLAGPFLALLIPGASG